MYGFWRLGFKPAPSAGAACTANGVATTTTRNEKKTATAPTTGTTQATRSRVRRLSRHRSRSIAGQDQQPEEERSLLPAPERGDRVAGRQLAARVLRDVDEREVVADECGEEDDRGDGARDEGADERVAGRDGEAAPALPGGDRAGDDRVEGEAERGDECGAAQLRQVTQLFLAVYFDGHFVTSESFLATKTPFRSSPLTETSRSSRN